MFRTFLERLGFDKNQVYWLGYCSNKYQLGAGPKKKEQKINTYSDLHTYFENKDYKIDIVYGKKRQSS